ncbi:MAG: aminopeptidase P N-terminal domain-containing protein [Bacteroidota bacterium]
MKNWEISSELFKRNRSKLVQAIEKDAVVILQASDQMPRTGDQFHVYRQNSDLFYLTGINQEKTILVLYPGNPDKKNREALFILKANKLMETWEGHKLTKEEARAVSGIENVYSLDEFDSMLHGMLYTRDNVYINLPEQLKFRTPIPRTGELLLQDFKKKYPLHQFSRLTPIMTTLRLKKEPEELKLMEQACAITNKAFHRVLHQIKPGMQEFEVEAEVTYEFLRNGAGGHAFEPIMASGKNACVLHYIENSDKINDGEMLLMDFGADVSNYAADCSRTIPANGRFTPRQRELYEATLRVFKYARSLIVPGTTINALHKKVCQMWEEEHVNLGLYSKEDAEKSSEDGPLWQKYFMHGTSHFLGLDVHDVGGRDVVFEPGMVLTCEPGIYIEEEGIGIRLENDILVTSDGNRDLMEHIPIEPDDIEAVMNSKR